MNRRRAFTLIELLIVVSIIAILASIAVPNFLEAQTRAKVVRAKADMATIAVALEMYRVDNNSYPETDVLERWQRFHNLTTPIAYLTTAPFDPFLKQGDYQNSDTDWGPRHGFFKMGCSPLTNPSRWAISSNGPDLDEDSIPIRYYPGFSKQLFVGLDPNFNYQTYDPTNGTLSDGDIWRLSDGNLN